MPEPTREERAARYRNGLCITCGEKRHSPGRPRCADCHRAHVTPFEPGMQRREREVS